MPRLGEEGTRGPVSSGPMSSWTSAATFLEDEMRTALSGDKVASIECVASSSCWAASAAPSTTCSRETDGRYRRVTDVQLGINAWGPNDDVEIFDAVDSSHG
eukprot:7724804-Pyramimonas_sp.AAC.1